MKSCHPVHLKKTCHFNPSPQKSRFNHQDSMSVFYMNMHVFLMCTFLKPLLSLLQYCFCCLCSDFFCLWDVACGILTPRPGIKPAPSVLQGKISTTGPPGKFLALSLNGLKGELCSPSPFLMTVIHGGIARVRP